MKKGIVMDIDDHYLTLLTPDGQFLRAKKKRKSCVIGEEVTFTPVTKLNRVFGIKQLSAAAAFVILLLGSLVPFYQNSKAYAYMSIDASPSIELGINKKMQVVKLTPYNSDGKKVISKIGTWEKEDMSSITKSIISEMKKQGYLKENHSVIISTVRAETLEEKTEKLLSKNINEIKELVKEIKVKPVVINGSEKDMKTAHQKGITTGKYKEKMDQPASKDKDSRKQENKSKVPENDDGQNAVTNSGSPGPAESSKQNPSAINNSQGVNSADAGANHTPPGQLKKMEGTAGQASVSNPGAKKETKKNLPVKNGQMKTQGNPNGSSKK